MQFLLHALIEFHDISRNISGVASIQRQFLWQPKSKNDAVSQISGLFYNHGYLL